MRRAFLVLVFLVTGAVAAWSVWAGRPPDPNSLVGPEALAANQRMNEAGERAIPSLLAGLDHPDPRVRARCLSNLTRLQATAAIPRAVELLRDPDLNVAVSAARALRFMRGWKDPAPVLAVLDDPNTHPRILAELCQGMGDAVLPGALPALRRLSVSGLNLSVRATATRALVKYRDADSEAVLWQILTDAKAPERVRRYAGMGLGRLDRPEVYERLLALSYQPNLPDGALSGVMEGLQGSPSPQARKRMHEVIADRTLGGCARVTAGVTLYRLGEDMDAEFLVDVFKTSPDQGARVSAIHLLSTLNEVELLASLADSLETETDPCIRCTLQHAIEGDRCGLDEQ